MWKVRMYMNTGFNAVNVPDKESTLESSAKSYKDFPAIDCLQRYFLSTISIRAFEDDIINGDYIKLWDENDPKKFAFYAMSGYTMTSGDTVDLNIIMDPLLTCGGVDNIDFLDGITSRRHLSKYEATPTEDDPYLVPTHVDKFLVGEYIPLSKCDCVVIVSSMYDLLATNLKLESEVEVNVTESSWSGSMITTPVIKNATNTKYTIMQTAGNDSKYNEGLQYYVAGYDADGNPDMHLERILENIQKLCEYGRSDAVVDAYLVPKAVMLTSLVLPAPTMEIQTSPLKMLRSTSCYDAKHVADTSIPLQGEIFEAVTPSLGPAILSEYYNYPNYMNERIFYGKHFEYTFVVRDSGETASINPEQAIIPGANKPSVYDIPNIGVGIDLTPNGRMSYYIPCNYGSKHAGSNQNKPSPKNIPPIKLSGNQWSTARLSILAADGIRNKAEQYRISSNVDDLLTEVGLVSATNGGKQGIGYFNPATAINAATAAADYRSMYGGQYDTYGLSYYRNIDAERGFIADDNIRLATLSAMASKGNSAATTMLNREGQRIKDKANLTIEGYPQTKMISNSSGNTRGGCGLLLYRSVIDQQDLYRFDQLLNQYGVKSSTRIKSSMLTSRKLYNYIDANGVSVKCETVPKSVRDDLGEFFKGGVRIWHVDPKEHTYTEVNDFKEV